jgi:hypothetical protein
MVENRYLIWEKNTLFISYLTVPAAMGNCLNYWRTSNQELKVNVSVEHFGGRMQIVIEIKPDIEGLLKQKQCQISH